MTMDLESLWWMDGTEYNPDGDDEELGSFLSTLHDIAAAPAHLLAAVLPEPASKAIKATIAATNPENVISSKTRAQTAATVSGAKQAVTGALKSPTAALTSMFGTTPSVRTSAAGSSSGGGGSGLGFDANLQAKLKGVQDIISAAKPRLTAKSSDSSAKQAGDAALAALVSSAVASKLSPDLSSIRGQLSLAANQRQATAEHLDINAQKDFRRKVLADLMRISTSLPANHPVRIRLRKVGLMSGLL